MKDNPTESIVEELEQYQEIVEELGKWLDEAIASLKCVPTEHFGQTPLTARLAKLDAYRNVKRKLKFLKGEKPI